MPKRNLIWIAAIVAAALVTLLITQNHTRVTEGARAEFDPAADAYRIIRENYLYPIDGNALRRQAIAAMAAQLDEYSRYIPPAKTEAFVQRMDGQAWGLGLKVEASGGRVTVVGALVNSPAQNSPFRRGDRIVEIDGRDVTELSQTQVEDLLDAPAPAAAAITVLRGDGERETLRPMRSRYDLQSVQGLYRGASGQWVYAIDQAEGLAYIRIREFLPKTPEQVQSVFRQLDRMRGLVLDLRDNPGGALPAAVEFCDFFLSGGVIVTVIDRAGRVERSVAHEQGTLPRDIPIVVLINSRTASAAELAAGAMRFHDRSVLVGTRTCGKGCVQSMIPLPGEMGQLNLTTAEFFVEPDRSISRRKNAKTWGIEPHMAVAVPGETETLLARLRTAGEVLQSPQAATVPASAAADDADAAPSALVKLDPQLAAAVKLLGEPERMRQLLAEAAKERDLSASRAAASQAATAATLPARSETAPANAGKD